MKQFAFLCLYVFFTIAIISCSDEKKNPAGPLEFSAPELASTHEGYEYNVMWSDVGAESYLLEESLDENFSTAISIETGAHYYFFSKTDVGSVYYYRVRTNTGQNDSGWSNVISVTISKKQTPWEIAEISCVTIPAGIFLMGNGESTTPYTTVTLSAFEMSVCEITQLQYKTISGLYTSTYTGDDTMPVSGISWKDAIVFCNKLSDKIGLEKCYDESTWSWDPNEKYGTVCDYSKNGFRLPTEAEWEYACRAGTTTVYYTGDNESDLDLAGWYDGNSGGIPYPVGRKAANAFGLFDMHGNVWEFCNDKFGSYSGGNQTNPVNSINLHDRVIRGGSYRSFPTSCKSDARSYVTPINFLPYLGFRIVRRPEN